MITSCNKDSQPNKVGDDSNRHISQTKIDSAVDELVNRYGEQHRFRISKGVLQVANL